MMNEPLCCECCRDDIYYGEEYYNIGGHIYCEFCVSVGHDTALYDDDDCDDVYRDGDY